MERAVCPNCRTVFFIQRKKALCKLLVSYSNANKIKRVLEWREKKYIYSIIRNNILKFLEEKKNGQLFSSDEVKKYIIIKDVFEEIGTAKDITNGDKIIETLDSLICQGWLRKTKVGGTENRKKQCNWYKILSINGDHRKICPLLKDRATQKGMTYYCNFEFQNRDSVVVNIGDTAHD